MKTEGKGEEVEDVFERLYFSPEKKEGGINVF